MHGGSGRWLWELYSRFPTGSVHFMAPTVDGDAEFDAGHGRSVERLPLNFGSWGFISRTGWRDYSRAYRQLRATVRKRRPNAVHCGKCIPEGVLAWMLKLRWGIPYVVYTHGEELTLARMSRELSWLNHRVLRGASGVIANCEHTRQLLIHDWGLCQTAITVWHPGVDTARFVPAAKDETKRGKLGWHGRRVVLTVGALQARKGQDMMLRALPEIRRRFPDVLFAMAGGGSNEGFLKRLAHELDVESHTQFRGATPDEELIRCYQQCDLFVLPNRRVGADFEGFGMVLVEAQSCGKAVLAGASGGTAETMDETQTGRLVPCESPEPLANAVCDMLADPCRLHAMGQAGRAHAVRRFDWTVLAREASLKFGLHASNLPTRDGTPINDAAV